MITEYYYADPTGNITLLAPLPKGGNSLPLLARALMDLEPTAEQVGFFGMGDEGCDINLSMAGGEFCGNAALSAAAIFRLQYPEGDGEERTVRVRFAGMAKPVSVSIRFDGDTFYGAVSMPAPLEIGEIHLPYCGEEHEFSLVRFEGITHLISFCPMEKRIAEEAVIPWCNSFGADALGILQIDLEAKTLLPLVYVGKSNTLFWESSCASGTAAAGAVLRNKNGPGSWAFREPAGTLRIDAPADGSLLLHGSVRLEKKTVLFR